MNPPNYGVLGRVGSRFSLGCYGGGYSVDQLYETRFRP